MARFSNLELDPSPEGNEESKKGAAKRPEVAHDERYWLGLAEENRRQGHYENALRFYSRALELDKAILPGWLGQTRMLISLEEYPEADLWARKALELFRTSGDLMAARAQALARLGNRTEALAMCDNSLKQEGQSAYRWMVRGELFVKDKQSMDRHCFDKAISFDRDWLVPFEIAMIYLYHRLPNQAISRLRQAAERGPDNPVIWYRRALAELELGLDDGARTSFARCLDLVPNHTEAATALANLNARGWSFRRAIFQLFSWRTKRE